MASSLLITGATGLIGTWLRWHLKTEPILVTSVGRRESDLLQPGRVIELIDTVRPEGIVHLAWCGSVDPGYRDSDDNSRWVEATLELADRCQRSGISLWATGTVVDRVHDAADAYTRAKASLRTALAPHIAAQRVGWLRPHYVFDQDRGRPALVAQALEAQQTHGSLLLREPDARHDFVHASDVGRAIALAVTHHKHGELPIGSGVERTVSDCVDAMGVAWETSAPAGPRLAETHVDHVADTRWLRGIGWTPLATDEFFRVVDSRSER